MEQEEERLRRVYDQYATSQDTRKRWSRDNPGNSMIARERHQQLTSILSSAGFSDLARCRVLDVGCGTGQVLASLKELGATSANLYGIDLVPERVQIARREHPDISFELANAETLHFESESFDLVLLFTVFTSILDKAMAQHVSSEVSRVLKPGGAVVWYDFRYDNPSNPNVRGMRRANIAALFPEFDIRLQSITLLPPLARRLGRLTPILYPLLSALPVLRTHYLGLLVKPS